MGTDTLSPGFILRNIKVSFDMRLPAGLAAFPISNGFIFLKSVIAVRLFLVDSTGLRIFAALFN
jgi:hypothetical protein